MNANAINTAPLQRRTSAARKLTGFILAALLLPTVPVSAASFVTHEPVPVLRLADTDTKAADGCALPQVSFRIDAPLVLRPSAGLGFAGNPPIVENPWTSGATSEWNAGMNLAVDRLVGPPENVNVYAAQTGDHLSDRFGGPHVSNETLAGFKIVIH